ncbi:MAG: pyruvate kinase [Oscillospiraceae bacterium]|jgi:pyruvate kinase|nr:pyruvate kinase [Oscillospiraceae bacterium]
MRKTKIVCTLGPATDDPEVLRQLIENGMDVARLNFSHSDHESHLQRITDLREMCKRTGRDVAILLDTKGPEIRTGSFEAPITLQEGQSFTLTTRDVAGDNFISSITYAGLPNDINKGQIILLDDGLIALKTEEITETDISCTVLNGGVLSSHKGINVPGVHLSMPYLSEKDRSDILFGIENGFDFIAASFTQTAQDIFEIRGLLESNNSPNIRIIAKIENSEGVENIDEIIGASDGIMVARGDLGVEIPLQDIPVIQKEIIKKVYNAGRIVITATQMLDSMMKNPRPTRAETTDVANAIYDGTSAIMLSGETAAGKYPVEALRVMATIAARTEDDIDYKKRFHQRDEESQPNVTNAISHATVTTAHDLGATAIITVTKSGKTARMISKFRPDCPIIACTTEEQVKRQLKLSWGIVPVIIGEQSSTDALFDHAVKKAQEQGLISNSDLVVITAGVPVGISGTTNLLKVHLVGDVLVSGHGTSRSTISGNICVCKDYAEAEAQFKDGDILVIQQTNNSIVNIMRKASAIITEVDGLDSHAAIVGLALEKPVIVGAESACKLLKSGTTVTVDAMLGIVYSGEIKK